VDHIPQGIAVFDAGRRLLMCNARYKDLLALPAALARPGASLDDIVLHLARRGDLGLGKAREIARTRLETIFGTQANTTRRLGAEGQHLQIDTRHLPGGDLVVSIEDVTDREQVEAELARINLSLEHRVEERTAALTLLNAELEQARTKADAANRDKTRFLAAASHDLLQPLNAARLYTSTLIDRARGSDLANLAQSIDASLNAVEEIMSTLLDISRIDSGALQMVPRAFDIGELLAKIAVEFRPLAAEKDIRLTVVEASAPVVTDRKLVARVMQNLVSNAIKYTRPGGRVLVGCRLRGNKVRLDVIDTGIGISPDQQSLIFTEFARLEQGARIAPGLGLGLSIAQRIVTSLGLALELDSAVDKGSRFSVTLPRSQHAPAMEDKREAAHPAVTDLTGMRILCVDNERAILDAMQGLLSGWGCEVRTALSLKQIDKEDMLAGWMPDLALMDYHLEQTSGLDAVEWLRQNVGGHLPAALITADRSNAVRDLAEARDIPVLTKPLKPAALRSVISKLVSRAGAVKADM
jgi:signal transduction histidine kinase